MRAHPDGPTLLPRLVRVPALPVTLLQRLNQRLEADHTGSRGHITDLFSQFPPDPRLPSGGISAVLQQNRIQGRLSVDQPCPRFSTSGPPADVPQAVQKLRV